MKLAVSLLKAFSTSGVPLTSVPGIHAKHATPQRALCAASSELLCVSTVSTVAKEKCEGEAVALVIYLAKFALEILRAPACTRPFQRASSPKDLTLGVAPSCTGFRNSTYSLVTKTVVANAGRRRFEGKSSAEPFASQPVSLSVHRRCPYCKQQNTCQGLPVLRHIGATCGRIQGLTKYSDMRSIEKVVNLPGRVLFKENDPVRNHGVADTTPWYCKHVPFTLYRSVPMASCR